MDLSKKIKHKADLMEQNNKQDEITRKNMLMAASILTKNFLKDVEEGNVKIMDMKDAKDMAAIYLQFNEMDKLLEQANSGAPQVSVQVNNILNKSLGTKDVLDSEGNEIEQSDISEEIASLSAEKVAKMASDRDKAKNRENEEQW